MTGVVWVFMLKRGVRIERVTMVEKRKHKEQNADHER